MLTYVILMNLTEQGIKTIKEAPKRLDAFEKTLEKAGGKLIGFYSVLGEYDYVAVAEIPTEDVGMSLLLSLGMLGNVRTKTLRAYPRQEFVKIVGKLQ